MKTIIRLTESDLRNIVKQSVDRILRNDEESVMNNYEPFEKQQDDKEHNWGIKGEEGLDPTHYDNFSDDIVNGI